MHSWSPRRGFRRCRSATAKKPYRRRRLDPPPDEHIPDGTAAFADGWTGNCRPDWQPDCKRTSHWPDGDAPCPETHLWRRPTTPIARGPDSFSTTPIRHRNSILRIRCKKTNTTPKVKFLSHQSIHQSKRELQLTPRLLHLHLVPSIGI